jgi:hypothetical protein
VFFGWEFGMRRSRGWLGVCAILALALALALAWPGAPAVRAATAVNVGTFSLISADSVVAGKSTTVAFSYTAPALPLASVVVVRLENVTVTVTVPQGWTASANPTVSCQGGASGCGVTTQPGGQIVVSMNLQEAQTFTLDYPATPPGSAGTFPFGATEYFNGNASATTALQTQMVTTTCPDGAGTMSVDPGSMTAGQPANLTFSYTAGSCGTETGGEVAVMLPGAWPPPAPGSVTGAGSFTPAVSGSMITVPVGNLGPDVSVVVFYYAMAQAQAPTVSGEYPFEAFEQSSTTGSLQALAPWPEVMVTTAVPPSSPSPSASPTSSPSASPTSSPSASATSSPSASATSSPSASATSSPSASPTSSSPTSATGSPSPSATGGGRFPIALVGFGLGSLGLLGLVVALGAAKLLASRRRHGGDHGAGGGNVRAVPRTGPPPSVTVRDTGTRPALTVRIEPRPYATVTTIEERQP